MFSLDKIRNIVDYEKQIEHLGSPEIEKSLYGTAQHPNAEEEHENE